jgi:hypothetical protein
MEVAPMTIAQRLGAINAHLEHATKCNEFIALARCITLSKGSHRLTGEIARDARLSPTVMAVLDSPRSSFVQLTALSGPFLSAWHVFPGR